MIKAVLFDVDGVLIDTKEGNRMSYNHTLKALGKKPLSRKEYTMFYAWPAKRVFAQLLPEKSEKEIAEIINNGMLNIVPKYYKYDKLNPHVAETIEKLTGEFMLGVVTNRVTSDILDFFNIRDYFGAVICLPDVKNHKPHPEPINLALKRLKVRPEEAVYVGDAVSDAEASKAAGVKVIIYRNPGVKGDYNIRDFGEILKIVEKLNGK
ncbi:MAG TPA: HAD-IA family hydrolase [archaeon]|nr:HAD-IA family hydrolase [archaeon]